jgi:hypothetical protein
MTDLSFSNPTALLAAVFMLLSEGQGSETQLAKADYDARRDRIQQEHRAARLNCRTLTGQAKTICVEQANADQQVARAALTWSWTGRPQDHRHWLVTQAETHYDVALAQCDDQPLVSRSACIDEASLTRRKALALAATSTPP